MTTENKYRCKHCGSVVERKSAKQWVKSYCDASDRTVHLQQEPLIDELLPIELTNDNKGRSKHWSSAKKRRDEYEATLRVMRKQREPFAHAVRIEITRVLGKGQRLWDADSMGRGNAKELVDALVAVGWFHDDGPLWITACDYRQDAGHRKHGPAVRVRVFRA